MREKTYMHFTHVERSASRDLDNLVPKRAHKKKYETGKPFPLDFYYPEVFFKPKPDLVSYPWTNSTSGFKLRASIELPLRALKRKFVKPKVGY